MRAAEGGRAVEDQGRRGRRLGREGPGRERRGRVPRRGFQIGGARRRRPQRLRKTQVRYAPGKSDQGLHRRVLPRHRRTSWRARRARSSANKTLKRRRARGPRARLPAPSRRARTAGSLDDRPRAGTTTSGVARVATTTTTTTTTTTMPQSTTDTRYVPASRRRASCRWSAARSRCPRIDPTRR